MQKKLPRDYFILYIIETYGLSGGKQKTLIFPQGRKTCLITHGSLIDLEGIFERRLSKMIRFCLPWLSHQCNRTLHCDTFYQLFQCWQFPALLAEFTSSVIVSIPGGDFFLRRQTLPHLVSSTQNLVGEQHLDAEQTIAPFCIEMLIIPDEEFFGVFSKLMPSWWLNSFFIWPRKCLCSAMGFVLFNTGVYRMTSCQRTLRTTQKTVRGVRWKNPMFGGSFIKCYEAKFTELLLRLTYNSHVAFITSDKVRWLERNSSIATLESRRDSPVLKRSWLWHLYRICALADRKHRCQPVVLSEK